MSVSQMADVEGMACTCSYVGPNMYTQGHWRIDPSNGREAAQIEDEKLFWQDDQATALRLTQENVHPKFETIR